MNTVMAGSIERASWGGMTTSMDDVIRQRCSTAPPRVRRNIDRQREARGMRPLWPSTSRRAIAARAKAAAKAKVAKPARTPKATKAPAAGPSPAIATRVPAPAPDAGPAASPPRGAAESPEEPPPRGPAAASAPPHMAMDSQPAAAAAVPGDPGSDSDSLAGRAPRKRPRRASASAKAPILSAMSQQAANAEMATQGGAASFVVRRQSKRLSSRQRSSRLRDTMAVSPEIGVEGATPFPPLSNPFAVLNDVDPGDNAGSASPVGGTSHAD
jgi:hypothetical protein